MILFRPAGAFQAWIDSVLFSKTEVCQFILQICVGLLRSLEINFNRFIFSRIV